MQHDTTSRARRLALIALIALVLLAGPGTGLHRAAAQDGVTQQEYSFPLPPAGQTLLVDINTDAADVTITGDPAAEAITVTTTVTGLRADDYMLDVSYQDSALLIYSAVMVDRLRDSQSIALALVVPETLLLSIATRVGDVTISGVTIQEGLRLWSEVGDVAFAGAMQGGEHRLAAHVGDVRFTGSFAGSLDLSTSVGDIAYTGQFGPEGTLNITSAVGDITIGISPDSSFYLYASVDVGTIESGLVFQEESGWQDVVSMSLEGMFAGESEPTAALTVQSGAGTITLSEIEPDTMP